MERLICHETFYNRDGLLRLASLDLDLCEVYVLIRKEVHLLVYLGKYFESFEFCLSLTFFYISPELNTGDLDRFK